MIVAAVMMVVAVIVVMAVVAMIVVAGVMVGGVGVVVGMVMVVGGVGVAVADVEMVGDAEVGDAEGEDCNHTRQIPYCGVLSCLPRLHAVPLLELPTGLGVSWLHEQGLRPGVVSFPEAGTLVLENG